MLLKRKRTKVFIIGRNKTGTTSMESVLKTLGYRVGHQGQAELLLEDWGRRDFRRIVHYCKSADAFQDVPFSLDFTYQILDYAFPESKFILTVRNSAEQWYESYTRYHTKVLGTNGLPTPEDVKQFDYCTPGWLWRKQQLVYGIDEETLYDPRIYMQQYERHNQRVQDYFQFRTKDLLILNLAHSDAMRSLGAFLNIDVENMKMPHLFSAKESAVGG